MKKMHCFQLWTASKESWGQVLIYERAFRVNSSSSKLIEDWFTFDQLVAHSKGCVRDAGLNYSLTAPRLCIVSSFDHSRTA